MGANRVRSLVLAAALVAAAPAVVLAQNTPISMPAIEFPISTTSIISAIFVAGAGILAAGLALTVGFRYARRLAEWVSSRSMGR